MTTPAPDKERGPGPSPLKAQVFITITSGNLTPSSIGGCFKTLISGGSEATFNKQHCFLPAANTLGKNEDLEHAGDDF